MIAYLDTSALLRLYIDEPGQQLVREAMDRATFVAVHIVGYAEIRAAFAWQWRARRVTGRELTRIRDRLEKDWSTFHVVMADELLVRRAGDLAEQFSLRGFDSLHLAAAESLPAGVEVRPGELAPQLLFLSSDQKLNRAASQLGLQVEARL